MRLEVQWLHNSISFCFILVSDQTQVNVHDTWPIPPQKKRGQRMKALREEKGFSTLRQLCVHLKLGNLYPLRRKLFPPFCGGDNQLEYVSLTPFNFPEVLDSH